jgi:hypothetical protein
MHDPVHFQLDQISGFPLLHVCAARSLDCSLSGLQRLSADAYSPFRSRVKLAEIFRFQILEPLLQFLGRLFAENRLAREHGGARAQG